MDAQIPFDLFFKKSTAENISSDSSSSSESDDLLSSSILWDSSDSDIDFLIENNSIKRIRREGFMDQTVPAFSDEEFKQHFRIDRAVVEYVEIQIAPAFEKAVDIPSGRPCIDSNTSLHLFLWYIGNRESFRQVCYRFNVSESTAHRLVHKVAKVIAALASHYIVFPSNKEFSKISNDFQKSKGIVRVIGAIGVSHIFVKRPRRKPENYISNKSDYSIIVQGICDITRRFTDIYVGAPGSLSRLKVLEKSPIHRTMTKNPNQLNNYCIIGEVGYPTLSWLVPPFTSTKSTLSSGQKHFNSLHCEAIEIINETYQILKNRFRRLNDFENSNLDLVCQCIISACVLHNICLQKGDNGEYLLKK